MSALDEQTWLSDELWAQVRPPPARFRNTISLGLVVAVVGTLVLSQLGFFHPRLGASFDSVTAKSDRLVVVLTLYDSAQLPVRVSGFRAAQPGARIVSTHVDGTFPPVVDNPAPDGTIAAPFTVHTQHTEAVTLVYVIDCAQLHLPLRVDIGTRSFFGNQTTTATLDSSTGGPLSEVCASR